MKRDFTYVDDVIEGVFRVINQPPSQESDRPAHKLYNIGNNNPVELQEFIATLEQIIGKSAQKNFLPMQPGDVMSTYADIDELIQDIGFQPTTPIALGLEKFVKWYREYY
jgi:UDP-glucuronate 4-epimerase